MIVIEILLGLTAAWSFVGHAVKFHYCGWREDSGQALIALILALGFLGLLLK